MSCDAQYILKKIISTGVLDDYCDLTNEQMSNYNMREDSGDFVFDGLVKMVVCHCSDDTNITTFRKINSYIERAKQ